MKENYTPGEGCECHAHSEAECGCDVDWTPREVYELREKCSNLDDQVSSAMMVTRGLERERDEAREQIEANHKATLIIERMFYEAKEQRDRLAEALREIADCDFVITLPDRMDAVRAIAREALGDIKWHKL